MTNQQILAIRVATAKLLGYREVLVDGDWRGPGTIAYIVAPQGWVVRTSDSMRSVCKSLQSDIIRDHIKDNYGIDLP